MWSSLLLLALVALASADDQAFFSRSAKWAHLTPSGGSLVSGRGNFRPGFSARDWRSMMAEPSFQLRKRSPARPLHDVYLFKTF